VDFSNLLGVEVWKERLKQIQLSTFEILAKVYFSPPLENTDRLFLVLELLVFEALTLQILYVCALFLKRIQTTVKAWAYVCLGLGCRLADGVMVPRSLQKSSEALHHFMEINRKAISECIVKCNSLRIAWRE